MADVPEEILSIADAEIDYNDVSVSEPVKKRAKPRPYFGPRKVPLVMAEDGTLVRPPGRPPNIKAIKLGRKKYSQRVLDKRAPPVVLQFGDLKPKKLKRTFNEVLGKKICRSIRKGCWRHVAAQAFGVPNETFKQWVRDYAEFRNQVETAEAQARQDAEHFMARTKPEQFLKQMHRHTEEDPGYISGFVSGNTSININSNNKAVDTPDYSSLTIEELETLRALTNKAMGKKLALPPKREDAVEAEFVEVSVEKDDV